MSHLDRSMHRSLWVEVAHSMFIEGLHTTKNTVSDPNAEAEFLVMCDPSMNEL